MRIPTTHGTQRLLFAGVRFGPETYVRFVPVAAFARARGHRSGQVNDNSHHLSLRMGVLR